MLSVGSWAQFCWEKEAEKESNIHHYWVRSPRGWSDASAGITVEVGPGMRRPVKSANGETPAWRLTDILTDIRAKGSAVNQFMPVVVQISDKNYFQSPVHPFNTIVTGGVINTTTFVGQAKHPFNLLEMMWGEMRTIIWSDSRWETMCRNLMINQSFYLWNGVLLPTWISFRPTWKRINNDKRIYLTFHWNDHVGEIHDYLITWSEG